MSSLVTTFENWEEFSILGLPRLSICSSNYSKTNTVHLQSSNYCPTQRTTLLLCKSSCVKILYGRQIFAQSDWRMERMQLACEKQLLWSKIFFGSDFKMWAQTRLPQNFCWTEQKHFKFYFTLRISRKHRKWTGENYIDEECTLSPLELYVTTM